MRISSAKDPKSDPKSTQRPRTEAAASAQVSSQENPDMLLGRTANSGGAWLGKQSWEDNLAKMLHTHRSCDFLSQSKNNPTKGSLYACQQLAYAST